MKIEKLQLRGKDSVCAGAFQLLRGRAPAQHRGSIATDAPQASCATLWWRWLVFSFFCVMEHRRNKIDMGKPKYSGKKPVPSATLSTTNPTWTDPGSNTGLRDERPATKPPSALTRPVLSVETVRAPAQTKHGVTYSVPSPSSCWV
jgi:hypothetical protein